MKAALINELTNEVMNIIELEADSNWQAPENHQVVFNETAAIGMFYVQGEFLTTEEYNAL